MPLPKLQHILQSLTGKYHETRACTSRVRHPWSGKYLIIYSQSTQAEGSVLRLNIQPIHISIKHLPSALTLDMSKVDMALSDTHPYVKISLVSTNLRTNSLFLARHITLLWVGILREFSRHTSWALLCSLCRCVTAAALIWKYLRSWGTRGSLLAGQRIATKLLGAGGNRIENEICMCVFRHLYS